MLEKIVVTPTFLPNQINLFDGHDDYRRQNVIARQNTAIFYCALYYAMFGGRVNRLGEHDLRLLLNGERRNFQPDIFKPTKNGAVYTEVKATSWRSAQPFCSYNQFENYCYNLLLRLDKGDKSPEINYAFFRYGARSNVNLSAKSNRELAAFLSDSTRDLLIVPANVLFLLFMISRRESMDQRSSDSSVDKGEYWRIKGNILSQLHKGAGSIDSILEENMHSINGFPLTHLALGHLSAKTEVSPYEMYCERFRVRPFKITRYTTGNYKEWLDIFKKHHQQILEGIRIRDLYEESS